MPFQVSQARRVVGNVVPPLACPPLFWKRGKRANRPPPLYYGVFGGGRRSKGKECLPEEAGGQASVRDSVRVSSGGSCCTPGTTMPRWSFSKDCFIWGINMDGVVGERCEKEVASEGVLDYIMLWGHSFKPFNADQNYLSRIKRQN